MPCRGGGPAYESYENPETKRRLDLATRVACEVLRGHSGHYIQTSLSKETRDWWAKHQAEAARREAAERAKQEKEKARAAALSKLSEAERKLLGL